MEKVRALVVSGIDPDSCDYDKRTALHAAAAEAQTMSGTPPGPVAPHPGAPTPAC